jgi:hypothetical protein
LASQALTRHARLWQGGLAARFRQTRAAARAKFRRRRTESDEGKEEGEDLHLSCASVRRPTHLAISQKFLKLQLNRPVLALVLHVSIQQATRQQASKQANNMHASKETK